LLLKNLGWDLRWCSESHICSCEKQAVGLGYACNNEQWRDKDCLLFLMRCTGDRLFLPVVFVALAVELQSQHTLACSEGGGFGQMCSTSPCLRNVSRYGKFSRINLFWLLE